MGRLAPMTDYDPGFRFAEAGLRIDTEALERARIARGFTKRGAMERAGYASGRGSSTVWRNVMEGRVKTIYTLARISRALGLDVDDVLVPVDGSVPGEA